MLWVLKYNMYTNSTDINLAANSTIGLQFPQISRVEGTLFKPNIWEVDSSWNVTPSFNENFGTEKCESFMKLVSTPWSCRYLWTISAPIPYHTFLPNENQLDGRVGVAKSFQKSCLGHSSSAGKGLMFTVLVWYALILLAPEQTFACSIRALKIVFSS